MAFNNVEGASEWTSTIQNSTGTLATSSFPLGKSSMLRPDQFVLTTLPDNKTFDQAIFAIELYGETWDFGPLSFTDVVIVITLCPFPFSPQHNLKPLAIQIYGFQESCKAHYPQFANIFSLQTAQGTDESWCTNTPANMNDATKYTISGLSSNVKNGVVTCNIANLTMESPA